MTLPRKYGTKANLCQPYPDHSRVVLCGGSLAGRSDPCRWRLVTLLAVLSDPLPWVRGQVGREDGSAEG